MAFSITVLPKDYSICLEAALNEEERDLVFLL